MSEKTPERKPPGPGPGGPAAPAPEPPGGRDPLGTRLGDIRVRARVLLPRTSLALETLAGMQPGSLLGLALQAAAPAELVVNGQVLARGEVVDLGGRRALRIEELE